MNMLVKRMVVFLFLVLMYQIGYRIQYLNNWIGLAIIIVTLVDCYLTSLYNLQIDLYDTIGEIRGYGKIHKIFRLDKTVVRIDSDLKHMVYVSCICAGLLFGIFIGLIGTQNLAQYALKVLY